MLTKFCCPLLFSTGSSASSAIRSRSSLFSHFLVRSASSNSPRPGFTRFVSSQKNVECHHLDDQSVTNSSSEKKLVRVEDSLKDLSSVKWRTEHNGQRLWPHDQWPERDLVNFPPYKVKEVPNAVRWYCVPESWFKFFYEKTGVTGPYMFFYGMLIYGFSKEYIVLWYDFTEYLILAAAVITVVKK